MMFKQNFIIFLDLFRIHIAMILGFSCAGIQHIFSFQHINLDKHAWDK